MVLAQILDRIDQYLDTQLSLDAFEDWFSTASWDIHKQNDQSLIDFVFAIEALLSQYHLEGQDESNFREKLKGMRDTPVRPVTTLPLDNPAIRATLKVRGSSPLAP